MLGRDLPSVVGWPGASILCPQDAGASSATSSDGEDWVLPWQLLAGTLTSACGCQLAGAKDKAQLHLSQHQLSFAKDRFRQSCEGSGLGPAFACAFGGDTKVALRYDNTFVLCVSP